MDALSRRYALFTSLRAKLLGFEHIISMYETDLDFCDIYKSCEKGAVDNFFRHEGYLFRENRLCVPNCSMLELLVREAHSSGFLGHFGVHKTLEMLGKHFYWSKMKVDVGRICSRCITCKRVKSKVLPQGLYTLLPTPSEP